MSPHQRERSNYGRAEIYGFVPLENLKALGMVPHDVWGLLRGWLNPESLVFLKFYFPPLIASAIKSRGESYFGIAWQGLRHFLSWQARGHRILDIITQEFRFYYKKYPVIFHGILLATWAHFTKRTDYGANRTDNGTNCTDNGTNRMVCKMCPDIQKHSMKNARILFIVKSELLGYNVDLCSSSSTSSPIIFNSFRSSSMFYKAACPSLRISLSS